jgi:prepilin-type N-terminal cleavage/methylation domain-containing protein
VTPETTLGVSRNQRGFSLLELVIVIAIIVLLLVIAVDKLLPLRVDAERTAMENVLGALKSALNIEVAAHIARGQIPLLVSLQDSNPMNRLSEQPKNYAGEFDAPDPAVIEGGQWYFDRHDHTLVYRVSNVESFQTPLSGPARARFAVRLDYDDMNGNSSFDMGVDAIRGVRLEALETYSWIDG